MLEQVDLSLAVELHKYEKEMPDIQLKLLQLQHNWCATRKPR